ncbi:hypothetical protein WJX81_007738 [Elliptochloris bilobata]|uniref:GPI mannosyltransferase 1 n=1 Tax=Elliptochloris bilobata TaxID=381761 RepID=A0AAW1REN8_9CHLO
MAGCSPYERATYRYTPFLAVVLIPIALFKPWGKLVFSAADLLVAWLIQRLLRDDDLPKRTVSVSMAAWLFNPFTATISTRGNSESLVAAMLLLLLRCLSHGASQRGGGSFRGVAAAGALLGLATHWRLYPVIYAFPILRHLNLRQRPAKHTKQHTSGRPTPHTFLQHLSAAWPTCNILVFSVAAAASFVCLGAACYAAYGQPFLENAYLYHSRRVDPRHNFSLAFYPAYLAHGRTSRWPDRAAQLAQLAAVAALGWRLAPRLSLAMAAQTMAFVALNKVSTAQYFAWYWALLPLALPDLLASSPQAQRRVG